MQWSRFAIIPSIHITVVILSQYSRLLLCTNMQWRFIVCNPGI